MKLKTSQTDKLRKIFEAIVNLVDEVTLKVAPEGITIRAMDPAHVALIDFEMKKEAFDEYKVEEPLELTVDLKTVVNVLKRVEQDLVIKIKEGANALTLLSEGTMKKRFNIPLIEASEENLKVPSITFETEAELDSALFKNAIADTSIIGEYVTLKVEGDALYFTTKAEENEVEIRVDKDSCISFKKKDAKSHFSLEYLQDMAKIADIINKVKISLGNDLPLKLDFADDYTKIVFFLAPRVETE
ncbi:MAG: proliferating cell nuclear antigen (pcna) [Methanobacteriota archaeon]|nr:MAG: proliferating cell nuclear antigen (pcna) [Euryarchaeota archaeon]